MSCDPILRAQLRAACEEDGDLAEVCGMALASIEVNETRCAQMAAVVALAGLVVEQWRATGERGDPWHGGKDSDMQLMALARAVDQLGETQ